MINERLSAALADRYRIERELGQGGMATVYLAKDLKHDRQVALKVLKPELAAVLGAERFVVEIKTTASLQHPHILPLFDSGTADSFLFYVMPYIEGETLRDKLNRETQLSIDEAVRITGDVADALDYAHRRGVIHRDIKPENILLHDGRPMVADFGIALAVSAAAGGRMTETGLSLGTPHYMSPEQATADKDITARSDVYSLASVLYELLTGSPPHVGATAQQIIMKIVTEEAAPVTRVRKSVPPNVAAAIAKALEKLPADRFASAAELRDALRNPSFMFATQTGVAATAARARHASANRTLIGIAAIAIIAAVWGWSRRQPELPVIRYQFTPPLEELSPAALQRVTPLPDGSALIFNGPIRGSIPGGQLWIKRRDNHEAVPVSGTIGAGAFAVSPDGEWIVFGASTQLRKVPVGGGPALTLVSQGVAAEFGVTWLDDGTIVFVQLGARLQLAAVSENGGDVKSIWRDGLLSGAAPEALPEGNGVLFARCTSVTTCDLWAVELRGNDAGRQIMPGVSFAQYAPTGHIVYSQNGRLLAVGFDPRTKEVRGTPVALADSVSSSHPIRLSRSGTLVTYLGGGTPVGAYQMVWVDRTGRETPVDTAWRFLLTQNASNHGWALSRNGRELAIGLSTEAGDDIWIKQLPRGALSRLSYESAPEYRPRWTPDGASVTFVSSRPGGAGFYRRRADASGSDTLIIAGAFDEALYSPNGDWLLVRQGAAGAMAGGRDIRGMRVGRDTAPVPVLTSPYDEEAIALSPDNKWLAYQSDETGRTEVFVRSFPNTELFKRQLSNGGGVAPLWSRDGRELFYLAENKQMMSVRVASGATPTIGEPVSLFRVPDELLAVEAFFYTPWDVAADGRFIMARIQRNAGERAPVAVVAENFLSELRAKIK